MRDIELCAERRKIRRVSSGLGLVQITEREREMSERERWVVQTIEREFIFLLGFFHKLSLNNNSLQTSP
ncbi:hypothetical protein Hanom_Chr09g00829221 [Helianthus anomalus]